MKQADPPSIASINGGGTMKVPVLSTILAIAIAPACAHADRFPMPVNALSATSPAIHVDDSLVVVVQPITEQSWTRFATLKTRLRWEERPLSWGLGTSPVARDLVVPLVPLPS